MPSDAAPPAKRDPVAAIRPWLRHAPTLLGIVLMVGAIYVVQKEFRHLNMKEVGRALHALPTQALVLSFIANILSYGVLTFYDRLATIYAGNRVSFARTAFASFCAYALAHNLGFAAVSGAAVRYRLYSHWGLSPAQIAKVIAFCSLTFGLGGMTLGGVIMFVEPRAVPWFGEHVPVAVLTAFGVLMWTIVAGYIFLSTRFPVLRLRGRVIELPGWRMALAQVALASVDVAITASIMYLLLPAAHGLSFLHYLAIYLGSYAAGLVANVPGGLGVFDTAVLVSLSPTYLPAPEVLSAILLFRLYYYIIPLFLSGAMFAGNEVLMRRGRSLAGGEARLSAPDFALAASTGGVAICGAILLMVGLADTRPDIVWLDPGYTCSILGAMLMVLAIGLSQRVTLAWFATILLLLAGAGITAVEDEPEWITAMLVIAALSIAPFRGGYYRQARVISHTMRPGTLLPLLGLLGSVAWLANFEPQVRSLARTSWWAVVASRHAPNSVRMALALAVLLLLSALWGVIRPGRVRPLAWNGASRLRYAGMGAIAPPDADGMVLGEAGRAALPFRRVGNLLLGLGDPAGAEGDRQSAVRRLRDLAQQEGRDIAVWRVGPELLRKYADLGLTPLPLGADGLPVQGSEARFYLCCVPDRDLGELLPVLPTLGQRRFPRRPGAPAPG